MGKIEKQIDSQIIYDGKVVHLRKDKVLCSNGKEAYREVVDHQGGVGILTFVNNKVVLIKQFRYAYEEEMYEIPAGKLEKGEIPIEAAKRELIEETGLVPSELIYLGKMYPSCGYTNEIIYLFLANNILDKQNTDFDEDEDIDTYYFSIEEVRKMIKEGIIKDAKTICALYYFDNLNN